MRLLIVSQPTCILLYHGNGRLVWAVLIVHTTEVQRCLLDEEVGERNNVTSQWLPNSLTNSLIALSMCAVRVFGIACLSWCGQASHDKVKNVSCALKEKEENTHAGISKPTRLNVAKSHSWYLRCVCFSLALRVVAKALRMDMDAFYDIRASISFSDSRQRNSHRLSTLSNRGSSVFLPETLSLRKPTHDRIRMGTIKMLFLRRGEGPHLKLFSYLAAFKHDYTDNYISR